MVDRKAGTGGKGRQRTPGRPGRGAANQREALLDSARERFAAHGYGASSLRQIAADAHVTPALAHYYFEDKAGLLTAVVEERIVPLVRGLAAAIGEHTDAPAMALRSFVESYTRVAASNPWLPRLVVREVLSEGGALRDTFPQRIAGELAGVLRALVQSGQAHGVLRAELEPARVVLSIVSLCLFPFIAAPMVTGVLGLRLDPDGAAELARHHLAVLGHGVGRLDT